MKSTDLLKALRQAHRVLGKAIESATLSVPKANQAEEEVEIPESGRGGNGQGVRKTPGQALANLFRGKIIYFIFFKFVKVDEAVVRSQLHRMPTATLSTRNCTSSL